MRYPSQSVTLAVALLSFLPLTEPVHGDTDVEPEVLWTAGSTSWFTSGAWSPNAPTATDDAAVNNGGTVLISADTAVADTLYLGYDKGDGSGGNGSAVISGHGHLQLEGVILLGSGDGLSGSCTVSENGYLCADHVLLGTSGGGYGTFVQTGGTVEASATVSLKGGLGTTSSYRLDDGSLSGTSLEIGGENTGIFTQNGGTNTYTFAVLIGALDQNGDNEGIYELHGGDLTVQHPTSPGYSAIVVGWVTDGSMLQTGGSAYVDGELTVGQSDGVEGSYELQDGSLRANIEKIGDETLGWFTQSGGIHTVDDTLYLGYAGPDGSSLGGRGTYNMNDGSLTVGTIQVGYYGLGEMFHSGGTVIVDWAIALGGAAGSSGFYVLDTGAQLEVEQIWVGGSGDGEFQHRVGKVIAGDLSLWAAEDAKAIYTMHTGSDLTANWIGVSGPGLCEMTQDAGDVLAGYISIGYGYQEYGRYELHSGTMSAGDIIVGEVGGGVFQQTGGLNTADSVMLGTENYGEDWVGDGTYELVGTGELHAGAMTVGVYGKGTLTQSDEGKLFVPGDLVLGSEADSQGSYVISGGTLEAGSLIIGSDGWGDMQVTASGVEIMLTDLLWFGRESTFSAVAGTIIVMNGASMDNRSEDPAALAGLENTTLVFVGSDMTMEVAGLRGGGWAENFAFGGLVIGDEEDPADLVLIDDEYNGFGDEEPECLFVLSLSVGEGSMLDVNGLWVYVDGNVLEDVQTMIDDGMIVDSSIGRAPTAYYDAGNDWTVIPEPATCALLGFGVLACLAHRRRARPYRRPHRHEERDCAGSILRLEGPR